MNPINIKDLQNLNNYYHNINSSIHFVFGANNSGKTALIRDFIVKKNYIYCSLSAVSKELLYPRLAHIISSKFKLKNSSYFFKDFNDVLFLLENEKIDEKLSIIFDNFNELLKVDKEALEILLKRYKEKLSKKNIQIIILSSSIFDNSNQELVQKYKKTTFYMEDIPFNNISTIKNISHLDKLYINCIFGTSDFLLDYYNNKNDLIKNVYSIALQPTSPFFTFGFDYLKKNISDISTYCSILYAISKGNTKLGDIANFLNVKSTYLSRYMQKLIDLFIIKRELPLNDKFKNSKNGRYYIKDNFLRFWFFYIFDNLSLLEMKKHRSVISLINKTLKNNFIQVSYTDYIYNIINNNQIQYLGYKAINIGPWWDNHNNYIDIVAYDHEQITFISVLWDTSDRAKLHYGILKSISNNYKSSLKRNYIIISKNTYLNINKEEDG